MTMIGSPACPLGRLEGQARGGGEGEGRCRLSSPPPKGATPCDRPPRGAILIPRPLGVVDYFFAVFPPSRGPAPARGRPPLYLTMLLSIKDLHQSLLTPKAHPEAF